MYFPDLVANTEVNKLFLIPSLLDGEFTLSVNLKCDLRINADLTLNVVGASTKLTSLF